MHTSTANFLNKPRKRCQMENDLKIIAMVRCNRDWAYVFDRSISFKYLEEEHGGGKFLIGRDGPILDVLGYERAGIKKAFAGREFSIRMEDGSIRTIKDDWWSCCPPKDYNATQITFNDVESLKRCYVYSSGYCDPDVLANMVEEYDNKVRPNKVRDGGWRYDYYDYEKVIDYKDMRSELYDRIWKLEREKATVIAEARRWAALAKGKSSEKQPAPIRTYDPRADQILIPTKIEYVRHNPDEAGNSCRVVGVYSPGTTQEDIVKYIGGSDHGYFERYECGVFIYIDKKG